MPAYFTSDVHLRLDRPERSRRFARWVERLEPNDTLTIVGDLCDFWFAARQSHGGLGADAGLKALAEFRQRGGAVTIMAGNHDACLLRLYEQELGAQAAVEPMRLEVYGLRLLLLHGHLVGGHPTWKRGMETRAFLSAFRQLPTRIASALDARLEKRNDRNREADDRRQLDAYRQFASKRAGPADIVLIGHVHRALDDAESTPRLIVPGGWFGCTSFVKLDESGASLTVVPDASPAHC